MSPYFVMCLLFYITAAEIIDLYEDDPVAILMILSRMI